MKYLSLVLLVALAACAGQPITQAQINQAVANVNAIGAAGCTIVQPGLATAAIAASNVDVSLASTANAAFCAGVTAAAAAKPASGTVAQ